MISLSLDEQMRTSEQGAKSYVRLYVEFGYELGFGTSGAYPGHAHLFYWDVMYCPLGVVCVDVDGHLSAGLLLVVPPRTYFKATFAGPFAFLKFTDHRGVFAIPDKVSEKISNQKPRLYSTDQALTIPWVPRSDAPCDRISLELQVSPSPRLVIIAGTETIMVNC